MENNASIEVSGSANIDLLDHEPTRAEKLEMKLALKTPSQWLLLLCNEWAVENSQLLLTIAANFLNYKSYLKGLMSSQLLCRVSIYSEGFSSEKDPSKVNFWKMLGVKDEFDCDYISAQVEKFCSLYGLRNHAEEDNPFVSSSSSEQLGVLDTSVTAATMHMGNNPSMVPNPPMIPYMIDNTYASSPMIPVAGMHPSMTYPSINPNYTDPSAAAAALAMVSATSPRSMFKKGKGLPLMRKPTNKEIIQGRHDAKLRLRDAAREEAQYKRVAEKAAREASREERRRRKVEIREIREQRVQNDKEAALQRAAELVQSNRVPIEITRGAAAATAAANAAVNATSVVPVEININAPEKRARSSIIVSTARDLQQIVTHSRNLWAKYNAIAKQHNQKVNWITVAKELGIHVKVREKYARMYSRAEQRGFDFVNCGHFKIKDYPHIFLDPTPSEGPKRRSEGEYVMVEARDIAADNAVVDSNSHVEHLFDRQNNLPIINTVPHLQNIQGTVVQGTVIPGTIDQYNALQNATIAPNTFTNHVKDTQEPLFNLDVSQMQQHQHESPDTPMMHNPIEMTRMDQIEILLQAQDHQQQQPQLIPILVDFTKVDEMQIVLEQQPQEQQPQEQQHDQQTINIPTIIPITTESPKTDDMQIESLQQPEQLQVAVSMNNSPTKVQEIETHPVLEGDDTLQETTSTVEVEPSQGIGMQLEEEVVTDSTNASLSS